MNVTADTYFLDEHLAPAEARRHYEGVPTGNDIRVVALDEVEGEGFYTAAIREHGRPGWVYRFQLVTRETFEILDALNGRAQAQAA